MPPRKPITDLSVNELAGLLSGLNAPMYRLKQLLNWLYVNNVLDFSEMRNLPGELVSKLESKYLACSLSVEKTVVSGDGKTSKFLFKTSDGEIIEGVSIIEGKRHTLCLSAQAGCSFGCAFCASGKNGFARNLSAGEIIDQIRIMAKDSPATNLVFMGGGEPLANFDNFAKAYNIIIDQNCMGIGQRKITVSTAGYLPGIRELVKSDLKPVLALSLHSPFNANRSNIMPINKKYPVETVLKECAEYAKLSGRQITIEYIVIPEFNISDNDIKELVKLFRNYPAKINLIPLNPISEFNFRVPSADEVERVAKLLRDKGIFASIRWSKGAGIDAACGQLRSVHKTKSGKGR